MNNIEEVKELRVSIDGIGKLTNKLIIEQPTSELLMSFESTMLSKAWLGKVLGCLSVPTPYKNDGNRKEVKDIEPTADVNIGSNFPMTAIGVEAPKEITYIEKIDYLRQEIAKLDEIVMTMTYDKDWLVTDFINVCYNNVRTNLCEARFWLGFELERIREEETVEG